jgi:hypothetical protein
MAERECFSSLRHFPKGEGAVCVRVGKLIKQRNFMVLPTGLAVLEEES